MLRRTGNRKTARAGLVLVGSLMMAACSAADSGVTEASIRSSDTVVAADTTLPGADSSPTTEVATDGTTAPLGEPRPFDPGPVEWDEFDDSVDVATIEVPIDYANPDGPTFDLFVARYNALDQENRIGSLLVNPGGPGFGGSDFAFFAAQVFDSALLERFDIIGWDPRGTGESDPPIDCIDDYDPYFTSIDSTPESDEELAELVEVAVEFADACVAGNPEILDFVGTNNSARDIDSIRQALDEDTISYFGFSYGSELGGVWTTMFPDTVRAAVLDGAADPNADALEGSLQQIAGFEASLMSFLDRCADDSECAFYNDGDPEAAYLTLLDSLDEHPIFGATGRPMVGRDVAVGAVIQAMYTERLWPALAKSLAEAQAGDGGGLLALFDDYYERSSDGTYGNELEAFQVISCADSPDRDSPEQTDAENELYREVAPHLVPEGAAGGYFCNFFPPALDPRISIDGAGAGPIVVIGTTGDPATPFDSTVRMSNTLEDGRLVIVEADQHTGYGVNRCVIEVVNDYLIDLEAPADETECR